MSAPAAIADLVPHAGAMVLLDDVVAWDAARVTCRTASHRRADNPLRRGGLLPPAAAIEYSAQAVAVHGALNGRAGDGYLAAARDLVWRGTRLDTIEGALLVEAESVMVQTSAVIYRFRVVAETEPEQPVAAGQVTIMLAAPRSTGAEREDGDG